MTALAFAFVTGPRSLDENAKHAKYPTILTSTLAIRFIANEQGILAIFESFTLRTAPSPSKPQGRT